MPARRCGLGRLSAGGVLKLLSSLIGSLRVRAREVLPLLRRFSQVALGCPWYRMIFVAFATAFTSYLLSVLAAELRGTEDLVPDLGDLLRVGVFETILIRALSHG